MELATIHSRPPTIHSVLQTFVFRPFRYRSVADRCVEVTDTTVFAPIRWGSGVEIAGKIAEGLDIAVHDQAKGTQNKA
ncbi:MAG: hypothetical protein AUG08_03875 [Acidobacteria bacterium 13_1_20CM_2_55_15]|nr:MAG: hypothetical protein AUG08_03875 [Acidobacteria bacterium 13_1_20CM_2_55_15]